MHVWVGGWGLSSNVVHVCMWVCGCVGVGVGGGGSVMQRHAGLGFGHVGLGL